MLSSSIYFNFFGALSRHFYFANLPYATKSNFPHFLLAPSIMTIWGIPYRSPFPDAPGNPLPLPPQTKPQALNRLRPKFAIVCGDLVNMWPANDPEPGPSLKAKGRSCTFGGRWKAWETKIKIPPHPRFMYCFWIVSWL